MPFTRHPARRRRALALTGVVVAMLALVALVGMPDGVTDRGAELGGTPAAAAEPTGDE